jgi:hypothetical protein
MNKDEKRELRRKRLMENKAYQTMNVLLFIALMIWALVSFGSYLYSLVTSIFR